MCKGPAELKAGHAGQSGARMGVGPGWRPARPGSGRFIHCAWEFGFALKEVIVGFGPGDVRITFAPQKGLSVYDAGRS